MSMGFARSIHRSLRTGGARWLGMALLFAALLGQAGATELKRGVGIHHMLNWAETTQKYVGEPLDAPYVFPPFSGPEYSIDPKMVSAIKQAGFDFVRLTLDPGPFLSFDGEKRDELDRILLDRVEIFRKAGLSVIADFHPNTQHVGYLSEDLTADEDSPVFRQYKAMLVRTAVLLSTAYKDGVVLEPMNEPQLGYKPGGAEQWRHMQASMVEAIRAEAPDLPLVVTGGRGGGREGLLALAPGALAKDPNIYFSFHYYEPYELTHQGAAWGRPEWKYLSGVPYPPDKQRLRAVERQAVSAIQADAPPTRITELELKLDAALDRYARTNGIETINGDFDLISDWAKTNGIDRTKIFLGEFGVNRADGTSPGADDPDRLRWLHDVRTAAEAQGFAWCVWSLRDRFGVDDWSAPAKLDGPTMESLGLFGEHRQVPSADPAGRVTSP